MARIFITGSADGIGKMAAQLLIADGHQVVLHARNNYRAKEAMAASPNAESVVIGDLSSIKETINVAEQINKMGTFDAIVHNAAIGYREPKRIATVDGSAHVFAINALAPYILTCLINKPKRYIFTSSALHQQGDSSLKDLAWTTKTWNGHNAYADSKLHNVVLAFAVARKWTDVLSNAVEPGWVATKMGGARATDSLKDAPKTQVWLATSNDAEALVTGQYFYHKKMVDSLPSANQIEIQEQFLKECERFSGVVFKVKI